MSCAPRCPTQGADALRAGDGQMLRLSMPEHPFVRLGPLTIPGFSPQQVAPLQDALLRAAANDPERPMSAEALKLLIAANIATAEGRLGDARMQYMAALDRAAGGKDPQSEAAATANLGVVAALQGHFKEAESRLSAALDRYRALDVAAPASARSRGRGADASPPQDVAATFRRRDERTTELAADRDRAMDQLKHPQAAPARAGVVRMLLNLGNLAAHVAQPALAEQHLKDALALTTDPQGRPLTPFVQRELAAFYRSVGRADAAAQLDRQVRQRENDRHAQGQREDDARQAQRMGSQLALGGAAPTRSPLVAGATAAPIAPPSRAAEAAHLRLQTEATERERANDRAGALAAHGRAAMLAAVSGQPERRRAALANLQRLHAAHRSDDAAIFYGKQAVNAAQRLRDEVGHLDRTARAAYLADKRRSYVQLAGLLMQRDRWAEAETTLRLLKEEEGQALRPASPAAAERGRLPYTTAESRLLASYDDLTARMTALEQRRESLRAPGDLGGADNRAGQELMLRRLIPKEVGSDFPIVSYVWSIFEMQAPTVRAITAKPAAARSPQEREQLRVFHGTVAAWKDLLNQWQAELRALDRDAPRFATPLTPDESRRLAAGLRALDGRLASMTFWTFLDREPAPAPVPSPVPWPNDLQKAAAYREFWSIDRQLEGLDAELQTLDREATVALAGGRDFDVAGRAVLDTGPALLARLPAGAVALHYLLADEHLDILLVTRDGRRTWHRQPVSRREVERRIAEFRRQLQDRGSAPVEAAQALYRLLVKPVEPALAGATTLMLALDGALRYLPFAALHDGSRWLVQNHALAVYTTTMPALLSAKPAPSWHVAGFGSTQAAGGHEGLPSVADELRAVGDALPATIRLDAGFTAAALLGALQRRPPVVHLASHFVLRADDPSASYLVLGGGERLTLAQLGSPEHRFDGVELATLSACSTAVGGSNAFGQEVEALGALLQGQGAAAVLATLWKVDDDSTATAMGSFYARRERERLTKAQALREVQLAFIRGQLTAGQRADAPRRGGDLIASTFTPAPRNWAHPFHWAPFVLMGNWL